MIVILFTQGSSISIISAVLAEGPAVIITPAIARFPFVQCTLSGQWHMNINVFPKDVSVKLGFESATLEMRVKLINRYPTTSPYT